MQIVHGRAGAAIADTRHLHPELLHQHQRAQMRGRADAGMAVGDLDLLRAYPVEQLVDVLGGNGGLGHQRHGHVGDAADVVEVVHDVIFEIVVEGRRGGLGDVPDGDRCSHRARPWRRVPCRSCRPRRRCSQRLRSGRAFGSWIPRSAARPCRSGRRPRPGRRSVIGFVGKAPCADAVVCAAAAASAPTNSA